MQTISILGSTGTIGINTLNVIEANPDAYQVYALSANTQVEKLHQQCLRFKPQYAVMRDEKAAKVLAEMLSASGIEVLSGDDSLQSIASASEVDMVMCAIVGAAGLSSSLAAAKAGKKVLLANKESLVMSGEVFMRAVRENSATLLPIDSEHNAIFQCLPETHSKALVLGKTDLKSLGIEKILLTGSGGPFRTQDRECLANITPEQAIAHPNWTMGPKISVDSATMMNKGLEFIEACWLFSAQPDDIEIIVHPESIIHSMVQYRDGSVLAQLGLPDMKTPIAYGLSFPERIDAQVASLDFTELSGLHFEAANYDRFPALTYARQAMTQGGTAPAILNAANEVAVASFLAHQLDYLGISEIVDHCLQTLAIETGDSLDSILAADQAGRESAQQKIRERLR